MTNLATVRIHVFDSNGVKMAGFPLLRGPLNGKMAPEAITDKNGMFEFKASPNRDIIIKLLSPDNSFGEIFHCKSGDTVREWNAHLKHPQNSYLSKTNIIWFSKHSNQKIPHTKFKIKYRGNTGILTAESGEIQIQTIVGEPVEITYIFPDGIKLSKTKVYMAKRVNPQPSTLTNKCR